MSYDRTASLLPMLNQANVPLAEQGIVLLDAFARQVAFSLPIPPSEVDAEAYFQTNYSEYVCDQACRVNESIVISVDDAVARVRAVWMIRYQIVYCPQSAASQLAVDASLEVISEHQRDRSLIGGLGIAMSIVDFQAPGEQPPSTAEVVEQVTVTTDPVVEQQDEVQDAVQADDNLDTTADQAASPFVAETPEGEEPAAAPVEAPAEAEVPAVESYPRTKFDRTVR